MFALSVPAFPWAEYIHNFTWFMGPIMIAGIVVFLAFPAQRRRVALVWSGIGIFQVIFSGFYAYPYAVFIVFPKEVLFGLFVLTSGVVLITADVVKSQNVKIRRTFSLSMFILAALEIFTSLNYPLLTPFLVYPQNHAFLVAAVIAIVCGALSVFYKKNNRR